MKTRNIIFVLATVVLIAGVVSCVKSLEDEGIYNTTEYIGTVVEKSTMQPIKGVKVQVTDGTHVHASTETDNQGKFDLKDINFEEVDKDYYLWLDGSAIDLPSAQETLQGLGRKLYDYKALILYDKTNANLLPKVNTDEIINITVRSADVKGAVTSDGNHAVKERGVCYATHQTPTLTDKKVAAGSGLGIYTCSLSGLSKSTTYYVRTYATNSIGTVFGAQKMFTTKDGKASITTTTATEVKATSAIVGGNITADGGDAITARGIVWATTQNPTLSNNRTTNGTGTGSFTHTLQGLQTGTTYYYRAYATNSTGTTYATQKSFTTTSGLPVLTTTAVTNITATTAKCGGNITDNGGYNVTARGICWNTTGNPDLSDDHTTNGTGNGTFTGNMLNLQHGTTYRVRAYATNQMGTAYGNEIQLTTTSGGITITIANVTNVTATSAVCGGNIAGDGGSAITERGLCWSLSQYPTISGSHMASGTGTGSFSATMNGLTPGRTYYVRAYATNGIGTSYSTQATFTTLSGLPTLSTGDVSNITATSAVCFGTITGNGGYPVTARGICWNMYGNPDVGGSHTTNGTGNGTFNGTMTGLTAGVTYHARAYATNANGTAYGNEVTFTTSSGSIALTVTTASNITATSAISGGNITNDGGSNITERGVCWSTNQYPLVSGSHTSSGSGTGSYTITMSGLSPATTYYVRAYAVNSVGTSYSSNQISFTTADGMPTVTTGLVGTITAESAVCNGNASSDGGFSITAKGFCWSTSQYPTIAGQHNTVGTGTGPFTGSITGLTRNTTYYVRAYATNSRGTSYGDQVSFTTNTGLPMVTTATATMVSGQVISGGNVISDGGYTVTARGICYGTLPNPDLTSNYSHTVDGSGTGYYSSTIGSITGTVYVRAYATNANGTTYGNQIIVNTDYLALPTFSYNGHTYRVAPVANNTLNWNNANSYCNNLTLYGYDDWTLPTKSELLQMYNNRVAIGGFGNGGYWSSTYHNYNSYYGWRYAYVVRFDNGEVLDMFSDNLYYVRPIRMEN